LTSRHAPCGRRGALPEVAPSVSINNPAPYRPCAGQANFLGYEAAARRPMGIHMCTVRMPVTPTYRGRGRGVSWPLVGVMALHSCSGQRPAAFRVRPRGRSGGLHTKGDWGPNGTPGKRPSRAEFHRSFRGMQAGQEMQRGRDARNKRRRATLLSQADKLACDHIFARFKIHITGCDSGTDMQ